jgi:hypothetical protein
MFEPLKAVSPEQARRLSVVLASTGVCCMILPFVLTAVAGDWNLSTRIGTVLLGVSGVATVAVTLVIRTMRGVWASERTVRWSTACALVMVAAVTYLLFFSSGEAAIPVFGVLGFIVATVTQWFLAMSLPRRWDGAMSLPGV